jgi:GntR family transcriptional repressor for pyruvate dehydrogenase complex
MERKRLELIRRINALISAHDAFPENRLPPEREFAKTLGVSRNLLREAIVAMEVMGLLETRERQGTFITMPGAGEFSASLKLLSLWPGDILSHLMEMRLIIEVPAASFAAVRRTEQELERMRDCVRHLENVQNDPDRGSSSGAVWDSTLHALVVNAAHNPVLMRMYEGLAATMERYIVVSRTTLMALDDWPGKILDEHRRIVEAIAARDPEDAMAALRKHLKSALEKLNELR